MSNFKVSIIGCGSVGSTTAYSYLLSGYVTHLNLIDIDEGKAHGLRLDLEHSIPYAHHMKIASSSEASLAAGSDLVVITAGARQKEGETRLDLAKKNIDMFSGLIPDLAKVASDAIFLVVSNPVDVLTYKAFELSGLPKNRVFGSGTILDSARLQFHISERLKIHPQSIDAYILGEHGDSSFAVYSSANVLGKPLKEISGFSDSVANDCYNDTKNAAYRIIHDQGYTCYSIATAVREITSAIYEDQHRVFPLSTILDGYYGHSGVALSVPCVLGRNGIESVIEVPLDEKEQEALKNSVETVRGYL